MKKYCLASLASVVALCATAEGTAAKGETVDVRRANAEALSYQFSELVKGSAELVKQYDQFTAQLDASVKSGKGMKEADKQRIVSACVFAARCHQFQTRQNAKKTPYISHPLTLAQNIIDIGHEYDADVIIAALLVDTIDETQATFSEVHDLFGKKVEGYLRELTQDRSLSAVKRKKLEIIHAADKSRGAATVKLSECLYNLTNLLEDPPIDWTRDRIDQYFQWAQAVVDNLPEASKPLKDQVHAVIKEYWKRQA